MKQQITFRQYRMMDVLIFTALLSIGEVLIALCATRWFPQELWTLSLAPAVTSIVMVRWGGFAAIPAAIGAVAFCAASGANAGQYAIYILGSLAPLVWCLWLKKGGWQKLREQVLLALFYGASVAWLMQLGRALVALLLGNPVAAVVPFITTDALSTLFAALVVWIARRLDGMLEEQKHYLRRVAEEQEKERQARANDPWQ